jgi:hypothetical protein
LEDNQNSQDLSKVVPEEEKRGYDSGWQFPGNLVKRQILAQREVKSINLLDLHWGIYGKTSDHQAWNTYYLDIYTRV